MGLVRAYLHSALASSGPWLFTVIALGGIAVIGGQFTNRQELYDFRSIIIYNFAFSLTMSGPVFMIATRYLADSIYNKDASVAPGLLFGAIFFLYATQLPVVTAFYFLYFNAPPVLAISAIANFMLITTIWMISIFLTALKDYKAITLAFFTGLMLAIASAIMLSGKFGSTGILNGFSIGLAYIMASLVARILAEYPYPIKQPFAFLSYFRKYWEIALGGLIFNIAVWADKWIMWFAPGSEKLSTNLRLYPEYDSAMFLAYLTIIPSMASFIFSVETRFYEHYLKFYDDIQQKATLQKIEENMRGIIGSILSSARDIIILQGSISITVILLAPHIFGVLGVDYGQIGMFRYGVLGAFFQVLTIFLMILLSYFDNRMGTLKIQILFLLTNCIFTVYYIQYGIGSYGYGYYLASMVTFIYAAIVVARHVNRLVYHTFITGNSSVTEA